jgi:hypothetical protein
MNRIASVITMHARDRMPWFLAPSIFLGVSFVIALFIALLWGGTTPVYIGALAGFYIVMLVQGIGTVRGTFPFAVGFGTRRRDYFLGTLAMAVAASCAWAILLGLLSLIEANAIKNWGVDLHFFYLPYFSDGSSLRQFCWAGTLAIPSCSAQSDPNYFNNGSPLQQFWVSFVFLLFLYLLGLLLGSIYQRFGRTGEYLFFGVAFLLLSVFVLVSTSWHWWGTIFGWFAGQSAAALGLWLVPLMACFALASYALLHKATV